MTDPARQCARFILILGCISAVPLAASADQASRLEEVIVTATKRESSLMETSASISAFDSSTLDRLGIGDSQDLVARTPSLSITAFTVSIRGVGRPNLAVGSEPGIGIYWDGVYNTENTVFNLSEYLDIERIEVLRGPQGTIYGRNSVGGAVSFISKRPSDEWGGNVTTQLSNYDGVLLQGLTSGPVTDKTSILLGASYIRHDGFQENTYNGKDYDQDETPYGTFSLEHQTTERWNTVLKLLGADRDYRQSNNGYILEPFSRTLNQVVYSQDSGAPISVPGMFPAQNFVNMRQGLAVENPALRDENKVRQDVDPELKNRLWSAFVNSEYSADTYTLKYTGGYQRYWYDTTTDADASAAEDSGVDWTRIINFTGTPVSNATGFTITPADMIFVVNQEATFDSHELQYSSEWDSDYSLLGGLYYYHSDEEQVPSFHERNDELMATYAYFGNILGKPVSDNNVLYRGEAHVDTTSYASYGQLKWDWTEETALTAGLRYSYDDKKGGDNTFVQFVGNVDDPTVFRTQEDTWDKWTWRLGVDHFLTPEHFLYGFIATGYRSGGFNFQKPTASSLVDVVKPEEILSYEVGYKGAMLDNRLSLASSVYYYDYTDLQVIKQDVVEGIALNTFVNAKDARAMGLEMEVQALPVDEVMLSATYSYNDTEYKTFASKDANACTLGPYAVGDTRNPLCTDELDLQGNEFALTPENKVSLNATYFWAMFELDWSLTGSYYYQGNQWMTPFNDPLYDKVSSWDRWDARMTAADKEKIWEVTAFIKNITDDREIVTVGRPSTVTQNAQTSLTDPRIYGLRLQYNF